MRELHGAGVRHVLLHPIGFVSDHMEILYDLDTEAKELGHELQMQFVRTSTAGTNPKFARMMADLVEERLESNNVAEKKAIGCFGPAPDVCAPGCCAYTPTRPAHAGAQRPQGT
jgi:ferrochelatase